MIDHKQPFDMPEWHAIARETKLVCQLMGTGVTSLGRAGYSDMMGEYYTAFFSLSVGIERLAKLILVVDHAILNGGTMPNERVVRNYGHKLVHLLNTAGRIEKNYGLTLPFKRPINKISCKIIDCLDAFADAARGRYANFAALGDPNIHLGRHEPIQKWWDEVANLILDNHYKGKKVQKNIEARADMIHKMMSKNSTVLHISESGTLMQDVYTASLHSGQTEIVQRFGRYYVLIVIRWLSSLWSALSFKACYEHNVTLFFGAWEYLQTFTVEDEFLKRRKIWPLS